MVAEPSEARLSGKRRPRRGRGLVHRGQRQPGLDHQHVVVGVDLAHRPHPLQREQHLALRDLAADQAGVAALRRDRRPGLGADADDGGHLGGGPRQHQQRRRPAPAVAPLHQLRRQPVRILAPAALAQHRLQARDHVGGDGGGHGAEDSLPGGARASIYSGIYRSRAWASSSRIPKWSARRANWRARRRQDPHGRDRGGARPALAEPQAPRAPRPTLRRDESLRPTSFVARSVSTKSRSSP